MTTSWPDVGAVPGAFATGTDGNAVGWGTGVLVVGYGVS